ncbi:MAG TPA: hypothetical protein VJ180_04655 [Pyrinomonadaceae bacterium]|nr:hypothetical protein [Pyrinomonadaceae bacterium]
MITYFSRLLIAWIPWSLLAGHSSAQADSSRVVFKVLPEGMTIDGAANLLAPPPATEKLNSKTSSVVVYSRSSLRASASRALISESRRYERLNQCEILFHRGGWPWARPRLLSLYI